MGQEVKNPLRAQSKYGLMESSAKTGKKNFRGSLEHFLDKNAICDRTPPPPTHQLQSTYVGEGSRVPNLQTEFNYLDSFKSYGIFSDFVVPMVPTLSPSSPRHPRRPHVIPVLSPSSPRHPHSPQKVPMWSPWLWSPWLWSPWSPPHVVPVVPTSSLSSLCHPHVVPIAPRRSPCGLHGCGLHGCGLHGCGLCGLHPMLSPWSLCRPRRPPCHPRVIPVVPTSSP